MEAASDARYSASRHLDPTRLLCHMTALSATCPCPATASPEIITSRLLLAVHDMLRKMLQVPVFLEYAAGTRTVAVGFTYPLNPTFRVPIPV
eukprot:6603654-Prymnesium_polylepis.2